MPISYQEQAQLSCPACGADFSAPVWLILDAAEEPDSVEALGRGALNLVACPACGNNGPAGAPLLFHDGQARRVIFAPAPGAAEHEVRDQARELHALLVGSIPEEQRRPYLADVDITQDLDGIAHLLRRLARRRGQGDRGTGGQGDRGTEGAGTQSPRAAASESRKRSEPISRAAASESRERSEPISRAAASESPRAPASESPPLLRAVEAMLAADSPEELDRTLAAHPVLREPATDATLAELAEVALQQRAFEVAESLRNARVLLAQLAGRAGPDASSADVVVSSLPELALQALLAAQSAAELEAAVSAHSPLLRPEVDILLAERVEAAIDEGNERLAVDLEDRREALAQLRAALMAERLPADPETGAAPVATLDEAIEALLIAEGEEALAETIDRYPVLLEEVAGQALWQFASEARASGDEELARYAVECREMLRRVREGLEN